MTSISARMAVRTRSCSSMSFRSATMSVVPMVWVPLNIMCSKKWLIPVIPGRSFTEPTWATHPVNTVGESWFSYSNHVIPLSRVTSSTAICGFSAAAAGRAMSRVAGPPAVGVRSRAVCHHQRKRG